MRKLKIAGLVLLVIGFTCALVFVFIYFFRPRTGGIILETTPAAEIYINNEFQGKTPFKIIREPGEITLRLIPESFDTPLAPYETQLDLQDGVETIIRRDFAPSKENSGGEIISYEKTNKSDTSLAVISFPDGAEVTVDNGTSANTPFDLSAISAGNHTVVVKSQGYLSRSIGIKAKKGYKLTVITSLAKDPVVDSESFPSETDEKQNPAGQGKKPLIEILSTTTGFVRVRKEPSTVSEEIGRVIPAQQYELIDQDKKSGWYKIKFDETKEGWVTNQYAKVIVPLTPSPAISPVPASKEQ